MALEEETGNALEKEALAWMDGHEEEMPHAMKKNSAVESGREQERLVVSVFPLEAETASFSLL